MGSEHKHSGSPPYTIASTLWWRSRCHPAGATPVSAGTRAGPGCGQPCSLLISPGLRLILPVLSLCVNSCLWRLTPLLPKPWGPSVPFQVLALPFGGKQCLRCPPALCGVHRSVGCTGPWLLRTSERLEGNSTGTWRLMAHPAHSSSGVSALAGLRAMTFSGT